MDSSFDYCEATNAEDIANCELVSCAAYGESATVALDACIKPMPKLCTLVAYYPDRIPSPAAGFPPSLHVLVHMAGSQGMGTKFHSYSYPEAQPGFSEVDLEEYDQVSASLAWTRTLAAVRKGFEIEVDLEKVWEEHIARKFSRATTADEKDCILLIRAIDSGVCH